MNYFLKHKKKILGFLLVALAFFAVPVSAVNFSDTVKFYVEKDFDEYARNQIDAVLVKSTSNFNFYVEKDWWNSQTSDSQNLVLSKLDDLSYEFSQNIYPKLTSIFGKEWNPGIDSDSRIAILFEAMKSKEGGYFRTADEYEKLQVTTSNEREILYLSLDQIGSSNLKVVLAHEFMHLITFNQKTKNYQAVEDTWLDEARADYSSTILGYDNIYTGSNLESRVKDFIANPSDSIVEWQGTKYDYSSVALFTHYLAGHYGVNILSDSLRSEYVGINSINYALLKSGSKDTFDKIFTNWTIASLINDCSLGGKYCYTENSLKNIKISPTLNFIPVSGNASLYVDDSAKNWQGKWIKFIGGSGNLKLKFSSLSGLNFQLSYVLEDSLGNKYIKFLVLSKDQKGEILVENFGEKYKSVIILPSLQSKISGFDDGPEILYPFTYSVFADGNGQTEDPALIQELLSKINALKEQIAKLQKALGLTPITTNCSQLSQDLYFGTANSSDVKCLQQFLKDQGAEVYPQGLVTGNFGNLTKQAVIRFQEKYATEILAPVGLVSGNGYVGIKTRTKINSILGQ